MEAPFNAIRYVLILVPAVATLYLSHIPVFSVYTFWILLFIWFVQLQQKWLPSRFKPLVVWLEIGFAAWLYDTYHGMLYLLFFSTWIAVFSLAGYVRWLPAAGILTAMNALLAQHAAELLVMSNLLVLCLGVFLNSIRSASRSKEETEMLYDELRRKHYELEAARKQMVDYAKKVEHLAQLEERNRIARDIHDELGHKLIRLKMMMEAAAAILPAQQQKGLDMVLQVRDQLSECMDILRKTVRNMKPDDRAVQQYSLHRLIEDLAKQNGIGLEVETVGMPFPLYPSEEIVLYRNAQEAVTNAIRHGQANRFRIRLEYGDRQVAMTVSNNGSVPAELPDKGLGLSGMEERVRLLGGQVRIDLQDEFAVTTIIPHNRKP